MTGIPLVTTEQFEQAAQAVETCSSRHNLVTVEFTLVDADARRALLHTTHGPVVKVPHSDPFNVVVDMVDGVEHAQAPHKLGRQLRDELADVAFRSMGIIACRRGR